MRILFCFVAFVITVMPPVAQAQWARFESQNFSVYSDRSEPVIKAFIEELEVFRIIAMLQLGLPVTPESSKKLKVIMFDDNREFRRVAGSRNIAGFFTYTNGEPRMVMGSTRSDREFAVETLFHEYIHFLTFENSSGFTYPRWYVEGIATVIGATIIDRDSVSVGRRAAVSRAIDDLGTLKMNDLLQNRSRGDRSVNYEARFYGTSWALTHYLQIHGLANDQELGVKTREYLTRYHQGDDSVEAFEDVFGTTLDEFDSLLAGYVKQRRLTVFTWTRPEISTQVTKTLIGNTERNYLIAELLLAADEEQLALEYLSDTDEIGQFDGETLSLKAVMLNHNETGSEQASALAAQAAAIATKSARTLANLAHYELDSYRRLAANGDDAAAAIRLEYAERYARSGLETDDTEFIVLWHLAAVLLVKGEEDEALEIFTRAWETSPTDISSRVEIAKLLIRRGEVENAKPIVRSLIGAVHDANLGDQLVTLAEQMETGEVDLSLLDQILGAIF